MVRSPETVMRYGRLHPVGEVKGLQALLIAPLQALELPAAASGYIAKAWSLQLGAGSHVAVAGLAQ